MGHLHYLHFWWKLVKPFMTSAEASIAFIEAFMEVVEASMEAWKIPWKQWKLPWKHGSFHESFRGRFHGSGESFHGSFHELPRKMQVMQETG